MEYVAKKDCFGYRDSFWHKGDIVEAGAGDVPPPPFKPVKKPAKGEGEGDEKKQ